MNIYPVSSAGAHRVAPGFLPCALRVALRAH